MPASPDSFPVCSPDFRRPTACSLDSPSAIDAFAVSLGAAVDLFIAAKAAEGASERTLEWYRMITGRAVRRFGHARPVDRIPAAELRLWLLELRETLAPESIAGYVRGLKAFGNWCNSEELAAASGFRALRGPHVPHKLIAPFSTEWLISVGRPLAGRTHPQRPRYSAFWPPQPGELVVFGRLQVTRPAAGPTI